MVEWPWRRNPEPQSKPIGITVADGRRLRLRNPFTHVAIKDGAIQLWGAGSYLNASGDGPVYVSGMWTEREEGDG